MVSAAAILSRHGHFPFSAGAVLGAGAGEACVAVWAQHVTVRARNRAIIVCFIVDSLFCDLGSSELTAWQGLATLSVITITSLRAV